MITVAKDNEFPVLIANFIEQLDCEDEFVVKLYVSNGEWSIQFDNTYDFHFMQEGVNISKSNESTFLWYDTLVGMQIIWRKHDES